MTRVALRSDTDNVEERRARWAEVALAGLLREVAEAPPGGRNLALNTTAHRAGRLVAAGLLPLDRAQDLLIIAAQGAGLPLAEARSTIRSGLAGGLRAGPAELPRELQRLAWERPRAAAPADWGYPPPGEVAALWKRCTPVWGTLPAAELRGRGLDPAAVEDLDLARALLPAGPLPRWAWGPGGAWSGTGHHLVLPLCDDQGRILSVHARRLAPGDGPKGLSPSGFTTKGLVLADRCAVDLLSAGPPPWWDGRVLLTEGVPSYLALACHTSDAERVPVTIGYLQGSWTAELAQRIPSGARLLLWPHADEAGEQMAAKITRTLTHCNVAMRKEDYGPRR